MLRNNNSIMCKMQIQRTNAAFAILSFGNDRESDNRMLTFHQKHHAKPNSTLNSDFHTLTQHLISFKVSLVAFVHLSNSILLHTIDNFPSSNTSTSQSLNKNRFRLFTNILLLKAKVRLRQLHFNIQTFYNRLRNDHNKLVYSLEQ